MHLLRLLMVVVPLLSACTASTVETDEENEPVDTTAQALGRASVARIHFGTTSAAAKKGKTSSFVIETTPDLVLHAEMACDSYDGQTVFVRGSDDQARSIGAYPHVLHGRALDVVFPILGTEVARSARAGTYTFEVVTDDQTVIARGKASFVSNPSARPVSIPRLPLAGGAR